MGRRAVRILTVAAWLAAGTPAAAAQSPAPTGDPVDRAKAALAATDYRTASPLFQQALAAADAANDGAGSAAALRGLAVALWGLGDYKGALDTQGRALALSRSRGDLDGERTALNGTGLDQYSLGNYPEALRNYRLALDADARNPSEKFQGLVWANIGLVYRFQGKFDEAYDAFGTSLELRRKAGDAAGVAQTLNHLGIVSRAAGRYDRAIRYYEDSAAARRETGDRQGEAQTLNNLGNVYSDLGDTDRAIECYAAAERLAEAIGYRLQIALSNENIAKELKQAGRFRESLVREQAALDAYRLLGRRAAVAGALGEIGYIQGALGDVAPARESLTASIAEARGVGDPQLEAVALVSLGSLIAPREPADGRARLAEAVALARKAGLRDVLSDALEEQGRLFLESGDAGSAIAALRESASIVNDLRSSVPSDVGKVGFLDRRRRVFRDLVRALAQAGRPEEALEAAESGRARALGDLLAARLIAPDQGLGDLRRALDIDRASDGGSSAPVDAALGALRAAAGELASLVSVEAPRAEEIRATATALHATIVEYLVDERTTYIWVIDPQGVVHAASVPVTLAAIELQTRTLRTALDAGGTATAQLRWFHRTLILPIAAWLPRSPDDLVVFVPDGALALVPFGAFTDAVGRPLVERHTVAAAPSVAIFKYTEAKAAAGGSLRDGRALVLAGPLTPAGAGLLADLPGARREAAAIVAALGAPRVDLLTGTDATESRVKRDAGRYALVHFATHGLISAEHPLASSLVLAAADGEDGYLRVDEIFALALHARLVVLSGCSTGVGRLSADGVLGLTRAFIYAGTPAVIVSQWDVSDWATATLMAAFYRAFARGLDPVHALRRAQLETRRAFPSPGRWAGFAFVGIRGDGGGRSGPRETVRGGRRRSMGEFHAPLPIVHGRIRAPHRARRPCRRCRRRGHR